MIILTIASLLSLSARAQLADFDESEKSCRDLGHCRSIWDIIWSCLVVIFTCTWLAIHPNIPKQGKGKIWKFWRSAGAFVVALIAPEVIILTAWEQRVAAQQLLTTIPKEENWTLSHAFFVHMGGFMLGDKDSDEACVLHPEEIGTYLHNGRLRFTEEDILDKSKGDSLTKGLVIVQTSWFILQLIARAAERLPVTELEITTLAFAILNCATYALWWHKPLDVERPIYIIAELHEDTQGDRVHTGYLKTSLSIFDTGIDNNQTSWNGYVFVVVAVAFGGVHCIPWSFQFPTYAEKLAWRIGSVITAASPIIMPLALSFESGVFHKIGISLLFLLYVSARLALLALAFTTLRSLPPNAYTTVHWTTFIPHI